MREYEQSLDKDLMDSGFLQVQYSVVEKSIIYLAIIAELLVTREYCIAYGELMPLSII